MTDYVPDPCSTMPAPPSLKIGDTAPDFVARPTRAPLSLYTLPCQAMPQFPHPAAFTPVCPCQSIAFAKATPALAGMG